MSFTEWPVCNNYRRVRMATDDDISKRVQSETEEKEQPQQQQQQQQEKEKPMLEKYHELTLELPVFPANELFPIRLFLGHWRGDLYIPGTIAMRDHFRARPGDTLLASYLKCGTTWLKSLVYAIATRNDHPLHLHPLLTHNPHELIHQLEDQYTAKRLPDLDAYPSPRIFHTHAFYSDLLDSMREKCKIVYICRDPKDNFTSIWHAIQFLFHKGGGPPAMSNVSLYCQGKFTLGSIWDHMIGYWNAHKEDPRRVMFLRYEELKRDVRGVVRRLGEFFGCPFTEEEEKEGVVEGIVKLCSLESLKGMEVNKSGKTGVRFKADNRAFFRKGEVGDWVNLLTPEMGEMIDKVTEEKLTSTGLSFHT